MKKIVYILTLLVCLSCAKKEDDNEMQEAQSLFQETVALISDYSTKIQNSKDSAEVDNLMAEFDKKLTDINFSYPSNTDLLLTEQDNDSIFKLMQNLKDSKKSILSRFHTDYVQSLKAEEEESN